MSQAAVRARTHRGVEIPDPGSYVIDKAHSSVEFTARHLMIAKVRGRFADFDGTIVVGDEPEGSSVRVTIQAASINTDEPARDDHLRSPDFLEVEKYPTLEFKSTSLQLEDPGEWKVHGDLTIKGVTRPVTLDLELEGMGISPWGDPRVGFSGRTEVNREDWGLTYNQALETGGVLIGPKIKIELGVEASKQS